MGAFPVLLQHRLLEVLAGGGAFCLMVGRRLGLARYLISLVWLMWAKEQAAKGCGVASCCMAGGPGGMSRCCDGRETMVWVRLHALCDGGARLGVWGLPAVVSGDATTARLRRAGSAARPLKGCAEPGGLSSTRAQQPCEPTRRRQRRRRASASGAGSAGRSRRSDRAPPGRGRRRTRGRRRRRGRRQ